MAAELVRFSLKNQVATITLGSPRNRNALSRQLRRELSAALARAVENTQIRVIVLDHTGPVFCSGMDLKEAQHVSDGQENTAGLPEILRQIWESPKPVIAKIGGAARAGGLGIIASVDIAISVEDATFAFTEVRIGVAPALISLPVLNRVNPRAAQELFLTGDTFDARRGVEIGLLTSAVAREDLDEEVERFTRLISKGGPQALSVTKGLINSAQPEFSAQALEEMNTLSSRMFSSAEAAEGMAAFTEKRPPNWAEPGS